MILLLLTNEITTRWNSKTKKYYENLGYVYTKMKNEFKVKVSDLKNGSCERVNVKCDFCGKEYTIIWNEYINRSGKLVACYDCKYLNAQISNIEKYGVKSCLSLDCVKEKVKETNLERYGVENPFSLKSVQEQIRRTNLEKYGVEYPTQSDEVKQRTKDTCIEKYGVDHPMKLERYKEMFRGENSPVWKGGIQDERFERVQPRYKKWRDDIYKRDKYTCAKCKQVGGDLECHHIFNFKDYPELIYEESNGITFCKKCHINFHRIYGKKFNNEKQLSDFLNKEE